MSTVLSSDLYHRRNRYLLMRHGHSEANRQGLIVSDPANGLQAFGLSPTGQRQLDDVTSHWLHAVPTRIVHSDFLRTTQTAQCVAERFGLTLEPEPRLRERYFGAFEGEPSEHYASVWEGDAADPDHSRHGVEAVSHVAARMQQVITDWEARTVDETIVLVSHGDPLQILLTVLAGKPLSGHRGQPALEPASITRVGRG